MKRLQPPHMVWHWGHPRDTTPTDRTAAPRPDYNHYRKVDHAVDLQADKKVTFQLTAVDEMGNPTSFDGAVTYAVDRPDLLSLTDNGDGSGEVAATGVLGTAVLTATVTPAVGAPFERSEAVNVVAGDAATFTFSFGEPEEVTPDS